MHSRSLVSAATAALIGQAFAQDATPVSGSPAGVTYAAELDGDVSGSIVGYAAPDGNGVAFSIHFQNLPSDTGPFSYHLHDAPAVDGNCTSTLAHLDPFGRGQQPPCDSSAPETCEVGDLSGKHGRIEGTEFMTQYTDAYVSLEEGDQSFFGNRSFVIHNADSTRLTCANFHLVPQSNSTTTSAAPTSTSYSPPAGTGGALPTVPGGPTPSNGPGEPSGAALTSQFSMSMALMGLVAVLFAL